jgi:hypothetical protein
VEVEPDETMMVGIGVERGAVWCGVTRDHGKKSRVHAGCSADIKHTWTFKTFESGRK